MAVNGKGVADYAAVMAHIDQIKERLGGEGRLAGADLLFMYDLFRHHVSSSEKMDGGCAGIGFGPHPDFKDSASFFLIKADSSHTTFSASKCAQAFFEKAPSMKRKREDAKGSSFKMEPGCLVMVTDLDSSAGIGGLKEAFATVGRGVKYVEMLEGEAAAVLRFGSTADAKQALTVSAEVNGKVVTTVIADAAAEAAYYKRMTDAAEAKRARALEPPKAAQIKITPGCLLSASGIPSDIRVHDLKEDFAGPDGQWNVRYVEMVDRADDGSQSVLIRYNSVDDCNAASAITELRSTAISCEVAGGDLEAGFWKRAQESADRRAAQGGGFGGGGRGGGNRRSFGRGGGGGNRRGGGRGGGGNRRGGGGGRWRR